MTSPDDDLHLDATDDTLVTVTALLICLLALVIAWAPVIDGVTP